MITPEAMREKLVEAMARAIWLSADPEEGAMEWWKEQARAALEAIEAQGLAIVPVKTTDAMCRAGWTAVFGGQQLDPNVNALAVCTDAMIQAGKL